MNFFSYFFKNERKKSKTTQTSFLMLEANKINSMATPKSTSIDLLKEGANEIIGVLSKLYTIPKQSWLCVQQHYLDNTLKKLLKTFTLFCSAF